MRKATILMQEYKEITKVPGQKTRDFLLYISHKGVFFGQKSLTDGRPLARLVLAFQEGWPEMAGGTGDALVIIISGSEGLLSTV